MGLWKAMALDEAIHDVYRSGFKNKAASIARASPNKWVEIPPGKARAIQTDQRHQQVFSTGATTVTPLGVFISALRLTPSVSSRQGRINSCVFSSAESGIRFGKFDEAALVIHDHIKTSLKHPDPMTLLHDLVKSKAVLGLTVMKCYRTGGLDLINYDRWPYPTTVQLIGADGGVGHTVTIVKEWIFDATMANALPLSRESLNHCCSSDTRHVSFVGVKRAVRMAPTGKRWSGAKRLLEQC